ncbi:hypothetical protein Leryth_023403, partial [Lithospermum erythrorhizon]
PTLATLLVAEGSTLKKSEAFEASKPLILERVKRDFDKAQDPMEVLATIARYMIKSLNASYSLATVIKAPGMLSNPKRGRWSEPFCCQLQDISQQNEGLKGENDKLKGEADKLKALLLSMQREKKEAQEQCVQTAERYDLLNSRYSRLEGEAERLTGQYKMAQIMSEISKKKAS